jgi:hypothetical protein
MTMRPLLVLLAAVARGADVQIPKTARLWIATEDVARSKSLYAEAHCPGYDDVFVVRLACDDERVEDGYHRFFIERAEACGGPPLASIVGRVDLLRTTATTLLGGALDGILDRVDALLLDDVETHACDDAVAAAAARGLGLRNSSACRHARRARLLYGPPTADLFASLTMFLPRDAARRRPACDGVTLISDDLVVAGLPNQLPRCREDGEPLPAEALRLDGRQDQHHALVRPAETERLMRAPPECAYPNRAWVWLRRPAAATMFEMF